MATLSGHFGRDIVYFTWIRPGDSVPLPSRYSPDTPP